MSQALNYPNQQNPAYSGITINITNPTLNPPGYYQQSKNIHHDCLGTCQCLPNPAVQTTNNSSLVSNPASIYNVPVYSYYNNSSAVENNKNLGMVGPNSSLPQELLIDGNKKENSYPPQYYMNNYNQTYNVVPESTQEKISQEKPLQNISEGTPINDSTEQLNASLGENSNTEDNLSSSKEIIENLNMREAQEKELEDNSKKVRVVALTNEYIMSLENYLNNPNKEIRLMASKEILTRLDEDKDRYDDAALNALLNKMLQDPEKLIRIAALSALSSQLASGNDYTVKLLNDIQNDPNADKEDVVQAANILLQMSASTEVRLEPVDGNNQVPSEKVSDVE